MNEEWTQLVLFGDTGRSLDWCGYVAALLDGEGYIGIRVCGRGLTLSPTIQVSMVHLGAINKLRAHYGGTLRVQSRPSPKHKDVHEWAVNGIACISPLTDALPFMTVKHEQARLVLSVAQRVGRRGQPLFESERLRRVRIYHQLRHLNQRGAE